MANLIQGDAMPNITTSQTNTPTAPDFYNNYLSNIATGGKDAIGTGGAAGASPLQSSAYAAAPTAINAGQPALAAANTQFSNVANTPTSALMDQYMNPYTQNVVGELGRLGERQFKDILAPAATSGAVGSGQFGSKRGMQVYGDTARDVAKNTLGLQNTALQSGFDKSLAAAQAQQGLNLKTGEDFNTLSTNAYNQGVGGLSQLSQLGGQQQSTEQARLNYPMTAESNYASLLKGLNIPTTNKQTNVGPIPGAYQMSPLSLISGLGTAAGSFLTAGAGGKSPFEQIFGKSPSDFFKGLGSKSPDYSGAPVTNPDGSVTYPGGSTYTGDLDPTDPNNPNYSGNSDGSYTYPGGSTYTGDLDPTDVNNPNYSSPPYAGPDYGGAPDTSTPPSYFNAGVFNPEAASLSGNMNSADVDQGMYMPFDTSDPRSKFYTGTNYDKFGEPAQNLTDLSAPASHFNQDGQWVSNVPEGQAGVMGGPGYDDYMSEYFS